MEEKPKNLEEKHIKFPFVSFHPESFDKLKDGHLLEAIYRNEDTLEKQRNIKSKFNDSYHARPQFVLKTSQERNPTQREGKDQSFLLVCGQMIYFSPFISLSLSYSVGILSPPAVTLSALKFIRETEDFVLANMSQRCGVWKQKRRIKIKRS